MKYKAVIFDLDGTLMHTDQEYRYIIVNRVLNGFGKKTSRELIDKFWYGAERDNIIKKDFGLDPSVFWKIYLEYNKPEIRKKFIKPYDDIGIVDVLRSHGIKTGIVTNTSPVIAELEIGLLGNHKFNAVFVTHVLSDMRAKPNPHGINECLKALGAGPKEAVFVGDGDEDILAARSAGVLDILIERGEHNVSVVPSTKIKSLHELKGIVIS